MLLLIIYLYDYNYFEESPYISVIIKLKGTLYHKTILKSYIKQDDAYP